MQDLILREVENYGWLGIIKSVSGEELYRTGNFALSAEGALTKLKKWRDNQPCGTRHAKIA
jgi:hypothetical protein